MATAVVDSPSSSSSNLLQNSRGMRSIACPSTLHSSKLDIAMNFNSWSCGKATLRTNRRNLSLESCPRTSIRYTPSLISLSHKQRLTRQVDPLNVGCVMIHNPLVEYYRFLFHMTCECMKTAFQEPQALIYSFHLFHLLYVSHGGAQHEEYFCHPFACIALEYVQILVPFTTQSQSTTLQMHG
ncbi:hypothetical protein V2J09_013608 [Rumex salicifolius]